MSSWILSSLLLVARQYPVELLIFLVLLWITVNRRDLSANRAYRKKKKAPSGVTSLRAPALTQEDLAHGMRVVSMKASDMSERMREIFNSNAAMLQQSLGGAAADGPGGQSRPPARRSPLERLLLNKDMSLAVFSCLEAVDISSLSVTSRSFLALHDPEFIWQQLWMQRYGQRVWRSAALSTVRQRRSIRWNPYANWGPPAQGWKLFFMEFEFGWLDWLLAGANTRDLCLLGYRGQVLDVTAFVDAHPGSGETLLDNAGCECSAMIEEIGHSSFAHSLMQSFSVTAAHPTGTGPGNEGGGSVEERSAARGDTQSDSASEDEGDGGAGWVCRPRSQLEARLALERAAALRVAESHRVTMYPVPAACGMKHKGNSLGHMRPVFGAPDADLDDPFVIVGDTDHAAPSSVPSSLVKMCPVAVGRGVSQESFAPHLSTLEGLQDAAVSVANGMWGVVVSVVSATVNAPQSDSGVAFAEWITVRHVSRNAPSQQAPVSTHIADELLSGIRSGEFTCCELASNVMWQRAATTAGSLLPRPSAEEEGGEEQTPDAALLEYVFDTAAVSPVTAQLFRDLPPAVPHMGQPKVFYDPLVQEWTVWWSCCGVSYSLGQAAINKECVRGIGS